MNPDSELPQNSSPPNPLLDSPTRRRWFQFSLRSFLVFVALVACFLVFIYIPGEKQRETAKKLRAEKASYALGISWAVPTEDEDSLRNRFYHCISGFKRIRVRYNAIETIDWSRLANLPELELDWQYNDPILSIANAKQLSQLKNLRVLKSNDFFVEEAAYQHLAELRELRDINLYRPHITAELTNWLGRLQKLEALDVSNPSKVSTQNFYETIGKLTNLRELKLQRFHTNGQSFTDFKQLTKLTSLNLFYTRGLTIENAELIASLANLEELDVHATNLEAEDVAEFAKLPKLKKVTIHSGQVTQKSLDQLSQAPSLAEIVISDHDPRQLLQWPYVQLSPQLIPDFQKSHPRIKMTPINVRYTAVEEAK